MKIFIAYSLGRTAVWFACGVGALKEHFGNKKVNHFSEVNK